MTFEDIPLGAVRLEARGKVIVARSLRVELVLERHPPVIVFEHPKVPNNFERRHFVIAVPRRVFIARSGSVSPNIAGMSYFCAATLGGVKPRPAHQRLSSPLPF
jgi:hypothetical protein